MRRQRWEGPGPVATLAALAECGHPEVADTLAALTEIAARPGNTAQTFGALAERDADAAALLEKLEGYLEGDDHEGSE